MHLNAEDLARLVDEVGTDREAGHLATCVKCAAELAEMKRLTRSLRELPEPVMPDDVRRRIARAIEAEPICAPVRPSRIPAMASNGGWLRAAAGLALFVLGGASGTFIVAPRLGERTDTDTRPVSVGRSTRPDPAGGMAGEPTAAAAASLARAEAAYLEALSGYARIRYDNDGSDPLSRLAALEGIVLTTRSALREAPADPVINGYHLTALGQRDELLRQIEAAGAGDEWF
jgi:hypothetical protein